MSAEAIDWAALSAKGGLSVADLPDEHAVGVRMELIAGSLTVTPLGDMDHQQLVGRLYLLLVGAHLPQGSVAVPGVNVVVGTRTLVIPDVAVIDPSRGEGRLGVRPEGLLLAVEITSPSTRTHDLTTKRELYASWGTPYIVIDRSSDPATSRTFGELPIWADPVLRAVDSE